MNLDLTNPAGAVLLVVGMLLLPAPGDGWRRLVRALGGTLPVAPVLQHLRLFPPFLDGQTYASYVGVPDPALWPAAAAFTAFGMGPLALALSAVGWRGTKPATTRAQLLRAAPAAALLCWGFEVFNGSLWWLTDSDASRRAVLSAGVVVMALSLHWRHLLIARVSGACALTLLGLCAAMLWLEVP